MSASAWSPDSQKLQEILHLLENSLSPNNEIQTTVRTYVQQFSPDAEFNCYLSFVLARMPNAPPATRQAAGLMLKNNIRNHFDNFTPEIRTLLKSEIVTAVTDAQRSVRHTVGSIVALIVRRYGYPEWSDILMTLLGILSAATKESIDGVVDCVYKMFEDTLEQVGDCSGLVDMVGRLIQLFKYPDEQIREKCLLALTAILPVLTSKLASCMSPFLEGVYALATDASADVRRAVCVCFCRLLLNHFEYIQPSLPSVIDYMLHTTQTGASEDHSLAVQACEFWCSISELDSCRTYLENHLPRVIPVLLKGMEYSEEDVEYATYADDDDDDSNNNKNEEEQIHPATLAHASRIPNDSEDNEEGDRTDYAADANDDGSWTLRKCAALALDQLSTVFREDFFPVLLPLVQERLGNTDWRIRESAILALGAIAEGCHHGMLVFLRDLVPYLLQATNDRQPLVRSISCWTLARYVPWISETEDLEHFLEPMVLSFTGRMLDRNRHVQLAACSAVGDVFERASNPPTPAMLTASVHAIASAVSCYNTKNLIFLCRTLSVVTDVAYNDIRDMNLQSVVVGPVVAKFESLPEFDPALHELFLSLTPVVSSCGTSIAEFAPRIYTRAFRTALATLNALQAPESSRNGRVISKEWISMSVDLIGSLVEALGPQFVPMVAVCRVQSAEEDPNTMLLTLLTTSLDDGDSEVRSSGFALIGELAKFGCGAALAPALEVYVSKMMKALSVPRYMAACNNAVWALGEICVHVQHSFDSVIEWVFEQLVTLLNTASTHRLLLANAALAIARFSTRYGAMFAARLATFMQRMCLAIRSMSDENERFEAYRSLVLMIKENPQVAAGHLQCLCDAVACYDNPPEELRNEFFHLLQSFKTSMGAQWQGFFSSLPSELSNRLSSSYNL